MRPPPVLNNRCSASSETSAGSPQAGRAGTAACAGGTFTPRAPNLRKARRHRARRRVSGYFETRLWLTVLSATTESQNAVTERTANNQLRARGATPTTDVSPHGQSWPCFGANGSQGDPKANNLALARVGRSVWTASVPLSLATSLGGLLTQRSSVQIRPGI